MSAADMLRDAALHKFTLTEYTVDAQRRHLYTLL